MTVRTRFTGIIVLATVAGIACTTSRDEGRDQHAGGVDTTPATTHGMPGMPGMTPAAGGEAMMGEMQQHLEAMRTARIDSLTTMLPMHRQMVANMISSFNTEMRGMHMQGDAAWQATVDSLRTDLQRMPAMSPTELRDVLPAHSQRMTHLMAAHHAMMSSTHM